MHILNQFFEKIYCINLLERPDRRNAIKYRFDKLGLEVEFYDAIKFGWGQTIIDYFKADTVTDFENPGQLGCAMSHYACIWMAKVNGYRNVLIFEDDVSFLKDFNKIINNYLNKIPKNWDMVYFAANVWKWEKQHYRNLPPGPIKNAYKANGAWAYGVNSKFYDKILTGLDNKFGIVDNFYMKLQQDANNNIYLCVPNLCMQGYSYSDLIKQKTNYFHPQIVTYMGKKPEDYE